MVKHREKVPLSQHDDQLIASKPVDGEGALVLGDQFADSDELEHPTRKKKPPHGRARGWVGSFLLGALFGGCGVIAAVLCGYAPAPTVGLATRVLGPEKPGPQPQAQRTFTEVAEPMNRGDKEKRAKAGVETLPTTKLGEFRFRSHSQKPAQNGVEVKAADYAVKAPVADLEQAKTLYAFLELGNIQILTGDLDKAEKFPEGGLERSKDERLNIVIPRVRFLKANQDKKADCLSGVWRNGPEAWCLLALALLTGAPETNPMAQPMANDAWKAVEPGPKFIEALNLVLAGNYSDAITVLEEAKKRHEKFQRTNPGERQNAIRDPGQDIFLLSCVVMIDALKARDILKRGGYPANQLTLAVNAALADAQSGKTMSQVVTKLTDAKLIDKPEELLLGVDRAIAAHKALADAKKVADESRKTMSQVVTKLTDAKLIDKPEVLLHHHHISGALRRDAKLIDKPEELLLGVDRAIAAHKALAEAKKVADETKKKLDDVTKLLVDAKFLEAADDALLVPSVREAIRIAEMKDPKGVIRSKTQNTEADWNKLVVVGNFTIKPIVFATTKRDKLTDDAEQELMEFAGKFKLQPRYYLRIEGHTLAGGDREASMALAQLRADAVKHFLVKQMGIDEHRLKAVAMEPGVGGREVRLVALQHP